MFVSRTKNLVLAGALGLGALVSLASPALAGPSPAGGGGLVIGQPSDPGTGGPGGFTNPTPLPDPEPGDLPIAQPDPQPQPDPGGFANPTPLPDPGPQVPQGGNGQKAPIPQADPDPQPDPQVPQGGNGDKGAPNPGGCPQTHGCPGEQPGPKDCLPHLGTCEVTDTQPAPECNPILASCDVTDREPGSGGGDPGQGDPEVDSDVEVRGRQVDRSALPRTGAGLAVLGLAGGALTGLGAGLRKLARRT